MGLSFWPPGTLWTGGTQSFQPPSTLWTGGTQYFQSLGTLWTGWIQYFWPPRYPEDWWDCPCGPQLPCGLAGLSVPSATKYPVGWWDSVLWPPGTLRTGWTQSFEAPGTLWTGGTQHFCPPRYPGDRRDSVLLAPQVPCGLVGLSPFSPHFQPPGTLWTGGTQSFCPPGNLGTGTHGRTCLSRNIYLCVYTRIPWGLSNGG